VGQATATPAMPEIRLTWHSGTVLPYASLWHTVLRACALNALHARDLPFNTARPPTRVELLVDPAGNVNLTAFAHALGEHPDAFRWSTLGAIPSWLSGTLVVPQPRLCFTCLANGYHAALFSIGLLETCPIHGTPLIDRCHCGAPFHATMRSLADYGTAGSCRCGRLHFFTHETCRRPALARDTTHAFDPVAAWLDGLSSLIRPRRLDEAVSRKAPGSIDWVVSAALALGLTYPACFRPAAPSTAAIGTACYRVRSGQTPAPSQPTRPTGTREPDQPSYWQATPATTIYRTFARHIRRHLAPNGPQWVMRFLDSCDPLAIGEQIRCRSHARLAFIDMLWERAVEADIEQRRWPDRRPPAGSTGHFTAAMDADCEVLGAAHVDARIQHWLACCAARISLKAAWRDAEARATAAACSGIADWAGDTAATAWLDSAWLARATLDGVGLVAPTATWGATLPCLSKAMRQTAYTTNQELRRDTMWAASRGTCLTWSVGTGWQVLEAIEPADFDLRRRRLLGLKIGRPWCWLYRAADGRFVARWDHARLQVQAATPAAAIAALRRCAMDYQRICQVALPVVASVPFVTPEPMQKQLADHYQFSVACVRARKGFWREAFVLTEAARSYQRASAIDGPER
jgi:hypothetical protein